MFILAIKTQRNRFFARGGRNENGGPQCVMLKFALSERGRTRFTVVSHLLTARPTLKDGIVVVDPSGQWLRTWREQFGRLEIGSCVHRWSTILMFVRSLARFTSDHALKRSHLPYDHR